ncbi:hypothetical protein MHU86_15871 [Fragilaria crotonensis]|nr:hypothetical protein MHU86_15871 [Fragilaria crotonensis]
MRPFTQHWPRGNHSRLPASTLSFTSQSITRQSMTDGANGSCSTPRFFSDESKTYSQEAGDQANQSTSHDDLPNIRAIQINQKIVEHGRLRQWKEILQLHRQQKHSFDPVCYATAICQLGGINSLDRRHLLFLGLLDDLIKQIQLRGMDWMDAGLFGDILHALAKMQLRDDHHAKEMINLIERQTQENPEWIFENGNPENIANFVWACGKLKVHAPNLLRLLDREAQTLFDYGNPQHISTSIWACGRLEIQSPHLFRILDQEAESFLDKSTPKTSPTVFGPVQN